MTVFQKRHACIFSRTLLSRSILGDLIAGVAVAGLLIPESMGYVCIAGLPAQTGLYATVMGLLAYAVSGSKHLVVSPASSAAAIVIHATAHLANFSEMRRYAKPKTGDLPPALTALVAVPTLGILPRLLLSVGLTLVVLLRDLINAHVVELGRIPGTRDFVDCARHPEAEKVPGVVLVRRDKPLFFCQYQPGTRRTFQITPSRHPRECASCRVASADFSRLYHQHGTHTHAGCDKHRHAAAVSRRSLAKRPDPNGMKLSPICTVSAAMGNFKHWMARGG